MRRLTTLPNQVRVVTESLKDRSGVAVGVWVAVGGRYEGKSNKGVAHFLEHMAFKGSKKYSCEQIKQRIEGVGGSLNAFTGEEETCYYAKVPSMHLPLTLDILADIAFFPKITHKDLIKERTVILEEIKMYHDLPQYYVMEILEEILWPDHPLGESLAGTPHSVSHMTAEDLWHFHQRFYSAQNIVVAACGDVDHQKLVGMVRRKLKGMKPSPKIDYLKARMTQEKPVLRFHHKNTEQMHLALGYLGYEVNHDDHYVLSILNIILGGNMSSRLFHEVREKHGLAYSISSGLKCLDDTGLFLVRAGVDNANITAALALILKVLEKTRRGISADELKRARDYYLGQFLLGLEDTMDHMIWLGGAVISNDHIKTMKEVQAKIKNVTVADLKRVAADILALHRLNVALVGPVTLDQEAQIRRLAGI